MCLPAGPDSWNRLRMRRSRTAPPAARFALVQAIATLIASGLEIMGVEPIEEMR